MILKCLKCRNTKIVKNWKRGLKQRYLCRWCWFVWEHWKSKNNKNIDSDKIFKEYVRDDLKYRQMWQAFNVSKRTIQRRIEKADLKKTIVMT